MKIASKIFGLGVIAAVVGAGPSSQATLLQVLGTSDAQGGGTITFPGGSDGTSALIGVYKVGVYGGSSPSSPGGLQSSWNTVCLSPGGIISGYESVTLENFSTASPGQFPNAWSLDGIYNAAYIYNTYIGGVTTANQGTALALAMYKALYDSNGYGILDGQGTSLAAGNFKASGYNSTVFTDYATYIASVNTTHINANNYDPGSVYYVLSDPNSPTGTGQEYIVMATPVPEPTTMVAGALLLLPFGASTLRMWRKSRAA